MIRPKELGLFNGPPLQKSTILLLIGVHLVLAGALWLLLSHEDYAWALIVLGSAIGLSGSFKLSAPEGKDV
jgi:hypothetical protein